MTPLDPLTSAGFGITGVFIFIFLIVYAIISFLLPFIFWGILRQARTSNLLLTRIAEQTAQTQRESAQENKEISRQLGLTVAALQRIKDSGDAIVTHAQYQTEVTKHRLALESTETLG